MTKLYFIGYAAQPGGVSLPVYGDAPCSCTVLKCPVGCVCECHHERELVATIKTILVHSAKPLSTSEIINMLQSAGLALPLDATDRWNEVAQLRQRADRELAREKGGK